MQNHRANSEFVFRLETSPAPGAENQVIVIPRGVSRLRFDVARGLCLEPASAGVAEGIVVEPLTHRRRDVVLLVTRTGRTPRINGQPAPSVVVLTENDSLLLDGAASALRLSRNAASFVGPVPADSVGRACPFCRVIFTPGTRVYRCSCGQALHFEDPAAGEDRLECAALAGECSSCGRPIAPGQSFIPASQEGAPHVD